MDMVHQQTEHDPAGLGRCLGKGGLADSGDCSRSDNGLSGVAAWSPDGPMGVPSAGGSATAGPGCAVGWACRITQGQGTGLLMVNVTTHSFKHHVGG